MLIDLAGGTVLGQKATEDSEAAHPQDLAVSWENNHVSQKTSFNDDDLKTEKAYFNVDALYRISTKSTPILDRSKTANKKSVNIPRHSSVLGTLSLTEATVSADSASGSELPGTSTRVHSDGLADDQTIADKLADGLTRVGGGDLVDLVRIKPDLALAAADHGGRQTLLRGEVDPV